MIKKQFFSLGGCLILFLASLEAVNMDPGSHLMYSRPHYAKYIDVQCYILNQEQLGNIFKSPDSPITQLTNHQLLNSKEIYLFVRLRNKGNCPPSFGTLHCFVPNVKEPFPVEVVPMYPTPSGYFDYAFQLNQTVLDQNELKPHLEWKWRCLYSVYVKSNKS